MPSSDESTVGKMSIEKPRIRIRKAEPSDADGVARVHVDSWRETYVGIVPQEHLNTLSYEKRFQVWKRMLEDGRERGHCFVAEGESGKVIGFSDGGMNRGEPKQYDGEVHAIYLLKAYQGKGIGRRLFSASLARLQKDGFTKALVWVLEENPTRWFYQGMGGLPVSEKMETIGGKALKEIAYGWESLEGFNKLLIEHPESIRRG